VELSRQTVTLNNPSPKLNIVALSNDQAPISIRKSTSAGLHLESLNLFNSTVNWHFEVATLYTVLNLDIFPSQ
jgi:hypothetical protein